jgi:hypothetical protein
VLPDPLTLYLLTVSAFSAGLFIIWILRILSTSKIVVLLFALDISLTVEAAVYSDVVFIAVLHVITIPAFFGLIYFDLVKQHNSDFRCFICGKMVRDSEDIQIIKRYINGVKRDLMVHRECISLDQKQRKAFSKNTFRKGIPE